MGLLTVEAPCAPKLLWTYPLEALRKMLLEKQNQSRYKGALR